MVCDRGGCKISIRTVWIFQTGAQCLCKETSKILNILQSSLVVKRHTRNLGKALVINFPITKEATKDCRSSSGNLFLLVHQCSHMQLSFPSHRNITLHSSITMETMISCVPCYIVYHYQSYLDLKKILHEAVTNKITPRFLYKLYFKNFLSTLSN